MSFVPGSSLSVVLFAVVVLAVLAMILWGASRVNVSSLKMSAFLVLWVGAFSLVVMSGVLEAEPLPRVPAFVSTILSGAVALGASAWGRALSTLPVWQLVVFQTFRLPLEIVLHLWAESKTVPETMTWTGQNFDVITGILALGVLFPVCRSRAYGWIVNVVGSVLLLNVLRVVVMSSPFPFSWPLERPLQLVFHLPYALIGIVCVWAALAGHIVLTRALLRTSPS